MKAVHKHPTISREALLFQFLLIFIYKKSYEIDDLLTRKEDFSELSGRTPIFRMNEIAAKHV